MTWEKIDTVSTEEASPSLKGIKVRLNTCAQQSELHIRILSYDQVIDFPNPCLHCLQNEVFLVPSSESSQEDDLGLIPTQH